jgi:hypothetical protein
MSSFPMTITDQLTEISPRFKARIAGFLYLATGMTFSYADGSVRGKLVVASDAAATAHNILTHLSLYRLGFALDLVSAVGYIAVTLILYDLLRPVNRSISMLAAFFSLAGCIIQAAGSLLHLAPLVVLTNEQSLAAFKLDQLQALALLFLKLQAQFANIYMEFFGCYCILIGYLIFRSTFMPRVLGIFLVVAGLSYQLFLSPPLATRLFPSVIKPAGALGELSLILWLMVMGVNSQRWKDQAAMAQLGF